jgi:alpha-beta hydrolase superfamily lysophospholipase
MRLHFKDELYDAQLLRAVGHAGHQGAEIGECLATVATVRELDADGWYDAWMKTARRVHALADESLAAGQTVSARGAYLRASNYFRTAYVFIFKKPIDERLRRAYDGQSETFRRAAALFRPAFEFVDIPYEGGALPAYLAKVDERRRPVMILVGGYDSTMEESYFFNVRAALDRGYHCLCFDGPGQGEMLVKRATPFRADWDAVVRPVVDYALTRPEIDRDNVVLMGLSFGGYLAARAAAGEPRLKACVVDPGQFDIYQAILARLPGPLRGFVRSRNGFKRAVLRSIFKSVLQHPSKGWAMRRALLVHDLPNVEAYVDLMRSYTLEGVVEKIACPTLVCDAENDDIAAFAKTFFERLTCPKAYLRFLGSEGAGAHCEMGGRALFHQKIFAWLEGLGGALATTGG